MSVPLEAEGSNLESFRLLADAAFEGIAVHQDGSIVVVNRALCEMSGYAEDELIGTMILEFVAPESRELVMQRVAQQIDGPYEITAIRRDGKRIPIEIVGRSVSFRGHPARLTSLWDLTSRKQREEEWRSVQLQLVRARQLHGLGLLAGGIAHDFNNLLAGIMGSTSILLEDLAAGSNERKLVEVIDAALRHGVELTEQLLVYAGRGQVTRQPVDLSALIAEMTPLIAVAAPQARILTRPCDGRPVLEADPGQLRQIVLNLVSNAAEAMAGSDAEVALDTGLVDAGCSPIQDDVTGSHITSGVYAYLKVTDSGCGMSTETVQGMFDPFYTTKPNGRGLGLAGVLGIVRKHHGAIRVDSSPGCGTTMTVYLPAIPEERVPGSAPAAASADER